MRYCIECDKPRKRYTGKYCSNRCQVNYQYAKYIQSWQEGSKDGNRGIRAKNVSRHLLRFLSEKYGEQCTLCHWNQRHQVTDRVPLEIDHIDGDANNNLERNLRLICPNCHSLTSNFRNLNKGKGRIWRREYVPQKSVEK